MKFITVLLAQLTEYLAYESCRLCQRVLHCSLLKTVCDDCLGEFSLSSEESFRSLPNGQPMKILSGTTYDDHMKSLVHKMKYFGDRPIADDLAYLMVDLLKELSSCDQNSSRKTVLVPIPLSRKRRIERGFNQSELIASSLSAATGIPLNTKLLKRNRHTDAQHTLNRSARKLNLKGAFTAVSTKKPLHCILVDDIYTSGATLIEAASTLKEAGHAEVSAITASRAVLLSELNS